MKTNTDIEAVNTEETSTLLGSRTSSNSIPTYTVILALGGLGWASGVVLGIALYAEKEAGFLYSMLMGFGGLLLGGVIGGLVCGTRACVNNGSCELPSFGAR